MFLFQWIRNGGVLLCGLSGLLRELVNNWADVATFLLNSVHFSILEADAEMSMRFAMWSIIMQIGKILSLLCSIWGRDLRIIVQVFECQI